MDTLLTEPVSGLHYRVRPGAPHGPCLLLLHGVGANEAGFIDLTTLIDPRITVVLARGPLEFGPGQYGWFQVSFTPNGPQINPRQAEASRQKLLELVRQLPQLHGVDPARMVVAGFSQGGIMSASVGLTAPELVSGFGLLSGRILPEVLPSVQPGPALGKLRAFVSHGVQDQKLGIHFARHAKDLLQSLGVPLTYHEYQAGHALDLHMVGDFQRWLAAGCT